MTYFEWVSILQNIKSSPMDYDMLDKLYDGVLEGGEFVYSHFISHVINTVVDRLDNAYENLIGAINSDIDLETLSLEIIKYKKELKFIGNVLDMPVIREEDRIVMKTNIDKTISDIYENLRNNIEYIDIDGHYVSTFEKIMNSDVEDNL
jgi:hypothetical protein